MPRGIDPSPQTSINATVQSSKLGVSATVADAIVFGVPVGRGVTVTTSEPGGTLPR